MFQPDYDLLKRYADVLVKFALWNGKWTNKDEVIFVQIPECAKPFYLPLQKAILESWAHWIFEYLPDDVTRHFYENANEEQIKFYPSHYLEGKLKQMTHVITIIAENDKYELKWIDGKKIADRISSRKKYRDLRIKKENEGKLSWTIAMYGTQAMAEDVGLSQEEFRNQIKKACFLDNTDPIQQWENVSRNIKKIKDWLNNLAIQWIKIQGEDVDLKIKIWLDRKRCWWWWQNIPSFEIYTSPDWRGTQWWIRFNQPLYIYGNIIKWISLKFEKWKISYFDAQENNELLKEIINIPNADKIWEFSLTDNRLSHIDKFMWDTLYDENFWWEFGNTHIAIWNAFAEAYKWEKNNLKKSDLKRLGFNECVEHKDIISTSNRTVIAYLENWTELVIYKNWQFQIDIS